MICSNPGGDPTALPTLSELIGSNVLEQAVSRSLVVRIDRGSIDILS